MLHVIEYTVDGSEEVKSRPVQLSYDFTHADVTRAERALTLELGIPVQIIRVLGTTPQCGCLLRTEYADGRILYRPSQSTTLQPNEAQPAQSA